MVDREALCGDTLFDLVCALPQGRHEDLWHRDEARERTWAQYDKPPYSNSGLIAQAAELPVQVEASRYSVSLFEVGDVNRSAFTVMVHRASRTTPDEWVAFDGVSAYGPDGKQCGELRNAPTFTLPDALAVAVAAAPHLVSSGRTATEVYLRTRT